MLKFDPTLNQDKFEANKALGAFTNFSIATERRPVFQKTRYSVPPSINTSPSNHQQHLWANQKQNSFKKKA